MDDIKKAIIRKEKSITKFVDKKEESIRFSSIRRDAALFTASRLETFKQASQKDFIEELYYWIDFFSTKIYKSPEALEEENAQKQRLAEKKDPLNHIDVDIPVVSSSMETTR